MGSSESDGDRVSERPLIGLAVITALTARPFHNGNGRLEILHIGLDRYNGRHHYIGTLKAIYL